MPSPCGSTERPPGRGPEPAHVQARTASLTGSVSDDLRSALALSRRTEGPNRPGLRPGWGWTGLRARIRPRFGRPRDAVGLGTGLAFPLHADRSRFQVEQGGDDERATPVGPRGTRPIGGCTRGGDAVRIRGTGQRAERRRSPCVRPRRPAGGSQWSAPHRGAGAALRRQRGSRHAAARGNRWNPRTTGPSGQARHPGTSGSRGSARAHGLDRAAGCPRADRTDRAQGITGPRRPSGPRGQWLG